MDGAVVLSAPYRPLRHVCGQYSLPSAEPCLSMLQVEATKFTEVGFHGRDVDQIIRDLVDNAMVMTKQKLQRILRAKIAAAIEQRIIDKLMRPKMPSDHSGTAALFRPCVFACLIQMGGRPHSGMT